MFQNQIQRYEEIQIASMKLKEQFDEEFRYKEMIKNLKAKMVHQQERMEYVLENIPKHIGNELKQHTLPKDAVAEKGKNIPRKVTSSKPMSINIPYDIQTWDLKVFKLDSMGRSVLNILRSLKRFREVRGNNHLRFVLLLNE
ncbi:hypothetical protein ROZALSC1DRAFT_23316 [Rozella allomycis CSF55]|uniref:Uncharacterized protein n=1 Tax=Rozella allomycis (strain CSF55) TaxID=988480 RepID=A0A4P9YFW6_ROZAC|nr:hypothetical protein ROZALSC1DRAFT_23316 [Rozella allomycis CSF55]